MGGCLYEMTALACTRVFIRNDSSCDIVLSRIEMFSSDVGIICTRPSVSPSSRSNLFQLMLYSSTDPQELLVVIQNTKNTLLSLLLSCYVMRAGGSFSLHWFYDFHAFLHFQSTLKRALTHFRMHKLQLNELF